MKYAFNTWAYSSFPAWLPCYPLDEAIRRIAAIGYDGVEIPIFEGAPDHYAELGRELDRLDLDRTAIGVIPSVDMNPIGAEPAQREAALKHMA